MILSHLSISIRRRAIPTAPRTTRSRLTPARSLISTRTCPTTCSTRYLGYARAMHRARAMHSAVGVLVLTMPNSLRHEVSSKLTLLYSTHTDCVLTLLTRYPSVRCLRSGCGARPGAATPRSPTRRRSTCATTRSPRSPSSTKRAGSAGGVGSRSTAGWRISWPSRPKTSARARQQKTSFRRGRMAQCVVVVCSCQSGCRWLSAEIDYVRRIS